MRATPERASCTDDLDLSVVVPVYRSEGCLEALIAAIEPPLIATGMSYEVVLVNDGSPDRSWEVIESLSRRHPNLVGIDLRRNFGQDNAILTGIQHARGKVIAIMDDDLQHDPADIPRLVEKLVSEDADVVYASFRVKHQRLWKQFGSWVNGKMAEWLIEKPKGIYLSPFKVIRGDIGRLICRYQGPDPYIDGFLFQVTSRVTQVTVEHHERFAGTSNYTLGNSLKIWARHATAFSVKPLRLVIVFGLLFAALGALLSVYVIAERLL
jgi:polyisoprenyl-phosphate glycosyltransferase